jgi:hypothetical protein
VYFAIGTFQAHEICRENVEVMDTLEDNGGASAALLPAQSKDRLSKLHAIATAISIPFSIFVTALFWILLSSPLLNPQIPLWWKIPFASSHVLNIIFPVFDFCIARTDIKAGHVIWPLCVMLFYEFGLLFSFARFGIPLPYPFLDDLNPEGIVNYGADLIFIGGTAVLMTVIFTLMFLGNRLRMN